MRATEGIGPRFTSDRSGRLFALCFLLIFFVFFGVLLVGTITRKPLIFGLRERDPAHPGLTVVGGAWTEFVLGSLAAFLAFRVTGRVAGYDDRLIIGDRDEIKYEHIKRVRYFPSFLRGVFVRVTYSEPYGFRVLWFYVEASEEKNVHAVFD